MNRRDFAKIAGVGATTLGLLPLAVAALPAKPQLSVTMDDFNWPALTQLTPEECNARILGALRAHSVKAALFVVGRFIDGDEGRRLLQDWDQDGQLLGNHSYSHRNYGSPKVDLDFFAADILRSEALLLDFKGFRKLFRFPMLKEGETAAKRDGLRTFLAAHDYRIGHVTIDTSDWIVNQRLEARLKRDPAAATKPYRDYYLAHMWERAGYYEGLARKVLGHSVKHTLLMHYNLLNALFLGDLLDMFRGQGWELIDAEAAFADPVFATQPKILPAGESLIWALAKQSGRFDKLLRYPGEDSTYEEAKMNKLGL
jgi:peptidoglycan-N-acetylglucosamine deacetylase